MGNTCIPVADYVKFKNKIKLKKKKKTLKEVVETGVREIA